MRKQDIASLTHRELFAREFQFAAPGEELDLGDIEVEP